MENLTLKKSGSAACLITEKQEAWVSSKVRMTHCPLYTSQNCLHCKSCYLLISEASQTHSLTMNSWAFTLSETAESVTFWVSVGSGEGDNSIHLELLKATTEQNKMLWFSGPLWSLILCSELLLENMYSPGIPSCFRVLALNWWMIYPARVRKLTEPDCGLKSFSERLPSCGPWEPWPQEFQGGSYGSSQDGWTPAKSIPITL